MALALRPIEPADVPAGRICHEANPILAARRVDGDLKLDVEVNTPRLSRCRVSLAKPRVARAHITEAHRYR